jgi:hypothetical protein
LAVRQETITGACLLSRKPAADESLLIHIHRQCTANVRAIHIFSMPSGKLVIIVAIHSNDFIDNSFHDPERSPRPERSEVLPLMRTKLSLKKFTIVK